MKLTAIQKLWLALIVLTVVSYAAVGIYCVRTQAKLISQTFDEQVISLAHATAASVSSLLMQNDLEAVEILCQNLLRQQGVVFCKLTNAAGQVLFEKGSRQGAGLRDYVIDLSAQPRDSVTPHQPHDDSSGELHICVSVAPLRSNMAATARMSIVVIGACAVLCIVAVVWLARLFGNQLLGSSPSRLSQNDPNVYYESEPQDRSSPPAGSFSTMTHKLRRRRWYNGREKTEQPCNARATLAESKLKQEVQARKEAQEHLEKRIKEINCLYAISSLLEKPGSSLEQIFGQIPELVRTAFRDPEQTAVRITFDGIKYPTSNFKKTEASLHAEIRLDGRKAGDIEVYHLSQDGRRQPNPFLPEEKELLKAVAARLACIAQQKRAERKLELFRTLLRESNDCIFVIDPLWGRILDANATACNSLGYRLEQLTKMELKHIDASIETDEQWQQRLEQLRRDTHVLTESRFLRKDQTSFPVETSFKILPVGNDEFILAIARDITERKEAERRQAELLEELEAANEELKEFAYIVSHDLKAPLRGIKTLAEWILADHGDKLGEQGREHMQMLLSRVQRMHKLIEGVLQYSRIGRVREKPTLLDLNELLPEIIDLLAPPPNIHIVIKRPLPTVEAEPTRITQVFQNLLSNAIKYMDKPTGHIEIDCVDDGEFWRFSVADNGPGIDEKYHQKIFQIFQTLSARDEYESTGIGLTIIKKIVELYGGRIWVESKPGQGSTFFFTFPKAKKELTNAVQSKTNTAT